MRQAQEFRDQAASYRQTASQALPPDVRGRYLGWAEDLDRRAEELAAIKPKENKMMATEKAEEPAPAPAPKRQWVEVKFRAEDRRAYTYHNDGPPLAIGDMVEIETKNGKQTVAVFALVAKAPTFATKPVKRAERKTLL